jgi:hypothetical protein
MPSELSTLSVSELLRLFVQVLDDLRRRDVIRSTNNPIADYAEFLFERALDLTRAPKSTKGYDAVDPSGRRYEIKARRITSHNRSRQLSAIRGLDHAHFTFLAAVLFREDFTVWKACLIPYDTVLNHSKYIQHTNSWKFDLRDDVWTLPGVTDVSDPVMQAERESHA